MLESESKRSVFLHTFDCREDRLEWAEEQAQRLIGKKGEEEALQFLTGILKKLSNKGRWESYDKAAMIVFVMQYLMQY